MSKVALVTGGSRGIGFGIATALAAEKWDVIINGVRPEEAVAEPLAALRSHGGRVGYARGDVSSPAGRAAIHQATRAFLPTNATLNLLVNNAGVAPKIRADLLETSEESYDYVVDTNLKGVFFSPNSSPAIWSPPKKSPRALAEPSSTSHRSPPPS